MKTKHFFLVAGIAALSLATTGCIGPRNLTFDSAKMLEKGEINGGINICTNSRKNLVTGLQGGYGLSGKNNIKFAYDGFFPFGEDFVEKMVASSIEIEDKIALDYKFMRPLTKNNMYVAAGIPLQYIFAHEKEDDGFREWAVSFNPKIYYTWQFYKDFEFNAIPKVHIGYSNAAEEFKVYPAISGGFGYSPKDRWAVRLEVGYGKFGFDSGIGFAVNVSKLGIFR